MQVSAEIRWFWPRGSESAAIATWFIDALRQQGPSASQPEAESRVDNYLKCSTELGLKKRGGKGGVEVKGLVGKSDLDLDSGSLAGPIEIWTKWGTDAFQIDSYPMVETAKKRWMRKFDTALVVPTEVPLQGPTKVAMDQWPKSGCNVEFTQISAAGTDWESFSFESFGALANVESSLRRTAELIAAQCPPLPVSAELLSYPAWLSSKIP